VSDALFDLPYRLLHHRKAKLESSGKQPTGHGAAALDYELGLGPVNKGRYFEHRPRRRQSKRGAARSADESHHLALRDWVWRSDIDGSAEIVSVNQPLNNAAKIGFVNP